MQLAAGFFRVNMLHGSSWLVEFQFCLVSIKNAALNVFLVIFISIPRQPFSNLACNPGTSRHCFHLVSLRFVGSSGAGKSRLINVLLGDAPVLPSAGEGSAVTAATVELRYCAQRPLVAELVWVVSKVAVAWIHPRHQISYVSCILLFPCVCISF